MADMLPMRTEPMGRLSPSGLDLMRAAGAKHRRRLQAMEASTRNAIYKEAFMDAFKARDPSGYYRKQRADEVQLMKEKAEIEAAQFEKRYTAKDKANLAKIQNQVRNAYRLKQIGEISEEDFETVKKQKLNEWIGYIPGTLPSLSPYPKGQGVGDNWKNEFGMILGRNPDGQTWQADFKKTEEGVAQEHELKALQEKAKLDLARANARAAYQEKLLWKEVPIEGDEEGGKRRLTPEELKREMELRFPSTPMPKPEEIQQAQQYLSMMIDRWGNSPPPEIAERMLEAQNLIKQSQERPW